ncbi:hypothetical protein ABM34_02280 [Companilactobacillus ginsenosidimutans]|uniref:Uncharacterized protein n=2 Tax=Companilactobacillus ginsenosidimutans TaxID=1007676 RepID=A0A0H4QYF0_9LACO|nr:hypothetical protein ABM34_02280 [Companilactobacillus ginsenosidimutans]
MLLTVLFGELLATLIVLALLQIVKIKKVQIVMYLLVLMSFGVVSFFTVNSSKIQVTSTYPFIQRVTTVKADLNDKKVQLTSKDFKKNAQDYDYVTYTELSENNDLYRGRLINQWGKVKKVIANDNLGRQIILDLNESNHEDTIKVNYHLSDLAAGNPNIKKNDRVKIYGEGAEHENKSTMPVIDAHFIETK